MYIYSTAPVPSYEEMVAITVLTQYPALSYW